ncbi:hypothetical protein [Georgenia sp. H159]|uniref:hypothetical protein n=1 Tax=Georgenia sp. H159 TaxID=3076115 RepID=UPI002D78E97E|nr:hypothetical protein [Georgenia sp. H159]
MSARRLVGVAAVLLVLTAPPGATTPPAAASQGGHASATGVTAVAGEVELDVTTSGAIGRLAPMVDRLTAGPVVRGRALTAVTAGTPAEPAGTESDSLGPVELGSLLVAEAVTAETRRVEDGVLSAESGVGGGRVAVLGLPVLDVGPVTSRVTTHPEEPPTARTSVSGLEVFGSPVTLPQDRDVDLSLALSTDQVLELLGELVPEVSAVTGLLTRVAGAAGTVDVTVRSVGEADEDAGAAHAAGFIAEITLRLDVDLCVPSLRGASCAGALDVAVDARVLDLELAGTTVERPARVARSGTGVGVAVALVALGAALLLVTGVRTVRRRRES